MRTKQNKLLNFAAVVAISVAITGCASNPLYTQTPVVSPTGQTNYVWAVAPGVTNALATAAQLNNSFVPAPWNGVLDALFAVAAIGLGAYARFRNTQAKAHYAAADLLAATVVKANAQAQALQIASGTNSLSTVAQHIDNNTTI